MVSSFVAFLLRVKGLLCVFPASYSFLYNQKAYECIATIPMNSWGHKSTDCISASLNAPLRDSFVQPSGKTVLTHAGVQEARKGLFMVPALLCPQRGAPNADTPPKARFSAACPVS